jgi:hypothetical protein
VQGSWIGRFDLGGASAKAKEVNAEIMPLLSESAFKLELAGGGRFKLGFTRSGGLLNTLEGTWRQARDAVILNVTAVSGENGNRPSHETLRVSRRNDGIVLIELPEKPDEMAVVYVRSGSR